MSRHIHFLARVIPCALAVGNPGRALAFEAQIDADLSAQLYELSSPWGSPRIERRRFTHTLALRATNLTGAEQPLAPRLDAVVRARVDADVAASSAEADPSVSNRYVPGYSPAPTDLMVAYVEGRNYLGGIAGFRAGRQYVVDALGWWSFDGVLIRLDTPAHFAVEAYAGGEQRGGLPMWSTSRFEADGVLRGNRTGLEPSEWPEYLEGTRFAPAVGGALELSGVPWTAARLSYRKVITRDPAIVSFFPDEEGVLDEVTGPRTSTERASLSLSAAKADLGRMALSGVYDLYLSTPSEHGAEVEWFTTSSVSLGARYGYRLPTYDADSIFNWFSRGGTTIYEGFVSTSFGRFWDVGIRGGARRFSVDSGKTSAGGAGSATNAVSSAEITRRHAGGQVGARVIGEGGGVGRQVGGELSASHVFSRGLYDTRGIVSIFDWRDETRPSRDATSLSYVAGLGYRPIGETRAGLEWEHAMNAIVGQRFRVVVTFEVVVR